MLRRELDYERLQILVGIIHQAYVEQTKYASHVSGVDWNAKTVHQFREIATRTWATRIDQQETPLVRQEDHNSLQEQE